MKHRVDREAMGPLEENPCSNEEGLAMTTIYLEGEEAEKLAELVREFNDTVDRHGGDREHPEVILAAKRAGDFIDRLQKRLGIDLCPAALAEALR